MHSSCYLFLLMGLFFFFFFLSQVQVLIDMINQHIIPACRNGNVGPIAGLSNAVVTLQKALAAIHHAPTLEEKAALARVLRLETMVDIRKVRIHNSNSNSASIID
jgi:hypothetical protein